MRKLIRLISGISILLTSCNKPTDISKKNYIESVPAFAGLHNGGWLSNAWLRSPENLLEIHETFKKVGYNNLIGHILSDKPVIINDIFIDRLGYDLIDSLVLTYKSRSEGTKYYKEFWSRRENEKNDSAVFVILSDIKYSYKSKLSSAELQMNANDKKVNDTLRLLLEIEYRCDSLTNELAVQDFETLRRLGFHQSAYNLLYETYKYQNIVWNRDSLEKGLSQTNKDMPPWFQDDTK